MEFFIPGWKFFTLDLTSWAVLSDSFRSRRLEVSYKKVFLKFLQNSKNDTCIRASFSMKLQASRFVQNSKYFVQNVTGILLPWAANTKNWAIIDILMTITLGVNRITWQMNLFFSFNLWALSRSQKFSSMGSPLALCSGL